MSAPPPRSPRSRVRSPEHVTFSLSRGTTRAHMVPRNLATTREGFQRSAEVGCQSPVSSTAICRDLNRDLDRLASFSAAIGSTANLQSADAVVPLPDPTLTLSARSQEAGRRFRASMHEIDSAPPRRRSPRSSPRSQPRLEWTLRQGPAILAVEIPPPIDPAPEEVELVSAAAGCSSEHARRAIVYCQGDVSNAVLIAISGASTSAMPS